MHKGLMRELTNDLQFSSIISDLFILSSSAVAWWCRFHERPVPLSGSSFLWSCLIISKVLFYLIDMSFEDMQFAAVQAPLRLIGSAWNGLLPFCSCSQCAVKGAVLWWNYDVAVQCKSIAQREAGHCNHVVHIISGSVFDCLATCTKCLAQITL